MSPENMEKSAVDLSVAGIADRLVRVEMQEAGAKRLDAERVVARRAGVSPSAIENLRRGRLKHVDRIAGRLKALYIAALQQQLSGLESDLAHARRSDPEADLRTAEAAIETARAALTSPQGK